MPYYPKSQIKTNLYAEPGKLLIASNYAPYTGYWIRAFVFTPGAPLPPTKTYKLEKSIAPPHP